MARTRLEDAYANLPPNPRELRRKRDLAASYKHDQTMENVAEIKQLSPERFAKLSPSLKMSFGRYTEAKTAANELAASEGN